MDSAEATGLIRSDLVDLRRIIASSDDVRQLKSLRDKADAVRTYARSAALGLELLNDAAELKIRAERKAGAILAKLRHRGGNRRSAGRQPALTLKELGVTRNQSRTWQMEARLPDVAFDRLAMRLRAEGKEISTAAVLRAARSYDPNVRRTASHAEVAESHPELLSSIAALRAQSEQFCCILVTPSWPTCAAARRGKKCPVTVARALLQVPMKKLCAPQCHLHLWCDEANVVAARHVLRQWGFAINGRLVCLSQHGSFGKFWRMSHSYLLLGVRGDLPFHDNSLASWLECEHKGGRPKLPPVYELLEQAGQPPFLHIFGEDSRRNWTVVAVSSPDGRC